MAPHPWMTEQLAMDRMRDHRQSAEQHRTLSMSAAGPSRTERGPTGRGQAGLGKSMWHSVSRRTGQLLIAVGRRLAGDDAPGLTIELARREAGHSPA
jgi:hypothetical protein